jgi:hypothetical protein
MTADDNLASSRKNTTDPPRLLLLFSRTRQQQRLLLPLQDTLEAADLQRIQLAHHQLRLCVVGICALLQLRTGITCNQ